MISIDLTGKTAVVTGGSQGLGASMVQSLSQAGAKVVINYFDDREGVNQKRADELRASIDGDSMIAAADVRDSGTVATMFDTAAKQFGSIDIVVNNAGIIRDRSVKKMTADEWQAVIDTNLTGVFNVCQCAAQHVSDGGRIVNLSSISAFMGFFGQCNYAAAKAGVASLTKVLSKELARRGITVNAVAPGVVLTEMGLSIPEPVREEMLKNVPLGRFGKPEEIASVVLFLCSDLASYVTGQILHVNGGWWG